MPKRVITDSDIYLARGIMYKPLHPKKEYAYDEDIIVVHHYPYFFSETSHTVKVQAGVLVDNMFECPICNKYSKTKTLDRIIRKITKYHGLYRTIDTNVTEKGISFDIKIEALDESVLYINYYSTEYFDRKTCKNKEGRKIKKAAKQAGLHYIELYYNHSIENLSTEFKAIKRFLKNHSLEEEQ